MLILLTHTHHLDKASIYALINNEAGDGCKPNLILTDWMMPVMSEPDLAAL